MWGNITDRPTRHAGVVNNEVNTMGCICPGDTILVVSERVKYSDDYPYLESVQVATPSQAGAMPPTLPVSLSGWKDWLK